MMEKFRMFIKHLVAMAVLFWGGIPSGLAAVGIAALEVVKEERVLAENVLSVG